MAAGDLNKSVYFFDTEVTCTLTNCSSVRSCQLLLVVEDCARPSVVASVTPNTKHKRFTRLVLPAICSRKLVRINCPNYSTWKIVPSHQPWSHSRLTPTTRLRPVKVALRLKRAPGNIQTEPFRRRFLTTWFQLSSI